ncbi:hypothetical protein EDD11_006097 [Mortierella claussenii]|nr:hypothetical protein EDD11_006097 [Mortierella claussenii]
MLLPHPSTDGSIYIITPIDPVFVFVPILDIVRQKSSESQGRFLTVDSIFESDQYTSLRHLAHLHQVEKHLSLVCQVQESASMNTFRLDDEKTMGWLKRKVELLINKFPSIPVLVDSIAYTESLPEICRIEAIAQSALRLVSAYLSEEWATKLAAEYHFPELDKLESRIQLPSFSDFGKRSGMDLDEDLKSNKELKKPKMSAGQRKLAKASTAGMKPLSSFFSKKAA